MLDVLVAVCIDFVVVVFVYNVFAVVVDVNLRWKLVHSRGGRVPNSHLRSYIGCVLILMTMIDDNYNDDNYDNNDV